jgi:pilus assembly protein FimV
LPGEIAAAPEAEPGSAPEAVAVAPDPASPSPSAAPTVTAAPSAADHSQLNVQRGDTLSGIAGSLDASRDYTLDQTMLALLRANPEAFIDDNINLLKQGAVLRVPTAGEVAQYSQAEAAAVVRDHVDQWRSLRQPAPQPAAVAASSADSASNAATNANARVTGARLAIMPPSRDGDRPGTRSGTSAGGEGEMLRQELQQSKEDLAARAAEVNELKARVAELEQLQQQQQQLISMKDSELAAAQQRLADARKAAPATVAAAPAQAADKPEAASATPWLFGGAGLIVLGLLAWLFSRRRGDKPELTRRTYDTAALAAGIPSATPVAGREDLFAEEVEVVEEPAMAPVPHWTSAPAAVGTVPTWHGGAQVAEPVVADTGDANQQLELARAYLDLGDDDAARALLREVLDGRDPAARDTAAKMLRDL